MRVKKYDYLINENGDIWMVDSVHKDGSVTISFTGGGGGEDDTLVYSAGQIESWFRKLPESDEVRQATNRGSSYLAPAPYWRPQPATKTYKVGAKKPKSRSRGRSSTELGTVR